MGGAPVISDQTLASLEQQLLPAVTTQQPQPVPEVGQLAAMTIEQCCEVAAQRVLAAANDFATLNASVQEEAKLLAEQLIGEGKRWAAFMTESTALAKTIHSTLQAERERIRSFAQRGSNGPSPSEYEG